MSKARKGGQSSPKRWLGLPLPACIGALGVVVIIAGVVFGSQSRKASAFTAEVAGSPRLKVDKELVDLGKVPLGTWVEASFDLQNVGDGPLKILKKPWIEVVEGC